MDCKQQGGCNRTIFSSVQNRLWRKFNTNREATSWGDRTREKKGVSLSVQTKGRREIHMRHNEQAMDHLLFDYEKISTERGVIKHQINKKRNGMELKQEKIYKYKNVLPVFIKSIDIEIFYRTNERETKKTQHIVLHYVMLHA